MKILILGSEGFIGRNCVKYYLQKGWDVYGCDLVDYNTGSYNYIKISRLNPDFDTLFSSIKYDACINAAGNGSVPASITNPVNDFDANCLDVIKILELLRLKNNQCKYLHISSAAVYGNPQKLPITEESALLPLSPYGWHKLISETLCKEYYQLYRLPVVIVRPFSVYGPGLRKQIFWDLYQKCNSGVQELTLWGTGLESRDFIYIDDLISAIYIILERSPMKADVYNLANGSEATIADASRIFINNFDSRLSIQFNNKQREGDPTNWIADINKLKSVGYNSEYTFAEGIKITTEWLRDLP